MEVAHGENVLDEIYELTRFRGKQFVYFTSISSSLAILSLMILAWFYPDPNIILIIIVASLGAKLMTLLMSSISNGERILEYEHLPSTNSVLGIDILFETTESLLFTLNSWHEEEWSKVKSTIFVSLFIEFLLSLIAYFYVPQPWSFYVIGVFLLSFAVGVIQYIIIKKFVIKSTPTLIEDWRSEYLIGWKVTEEDWREYREDFKRFNTLSITQVKIIKKYLGIAMGTKNPPSIKKIKTLISTFPNRKTLNDALDKGYLDYTSYIKGEQMGCPGAEMYEVCVRNGFETYDEMVQARANGFLDKDTMEHAYQLGCMNFSQYMEMKSHGFEGIHYSKYREIRSMGYESYSDYVEATESGFPNLKTWLLAKIHGIPTYTELQNMIKYGVILDPELSESGSLIYEEYRHALEGGFPSYKMYINAGARGFSTFAEMEEAEKAGFRTMEEWQDAKLKGFKTRAELDHAHNLGFESLEQMKTAHALGCSNMKEYQKLVEEGYETWDDLVRAKEKGFSSPEQYYMAKKVHAPDVKLYNQIKKGGFESLSEMRIAYKLGYFTKEEYDEGRSRGAPDAIALEEMDEKGFPNYEMFKAAKDAGFEDIDTYKRAMKWGAPDFETYQFMKYGNFSDYARYKLAVSQGFKDRKSFEEAQKFGAKSYSEYLVLKKENKLRSDYVSEQFSNFSRLQESYLKILDAYETLDNLRSKRPNDYYTLEKVVEVLDGIHSTLQYDITLLEEYNDVFPELRETYTHLGNKLTELFEMVREDFEELRLEFQPLREFLHSLSKYNVPATIPLTNYSGLIEKFGITYESLKDKVSRYFSDEIKFDLHDMIIMYEQWIASPSEKKKMIVEIGNKLSSLERGSSIGLGKVREMVEFKGTNRQFEALVNDALPSDGSLGIVRYDLGIIEVPSIDYYKENYSYNQVKQMIRDQISNAVLNSRVATKIMAVSSNISNKPPTPTFRKALKEVLEEFPTLTYNEDSGEIIPPVGMIGEECPICFGSIESGERVGICPNCNGQTHYNELVPWVLDNKRCPHCQAEIAMEEVNSIIA